MQENYLGTIIDFSSPVGEAALLAPDSVQWRVYKNPIALGIGGIAAVLLEFAEPRIRSGVWDHSTYKADPIGRSRRTGLVKNANSTCLIGKPLQGDLENLLARPVRLANDANCFALSEAADGAAAGADVVFGVIIGTGVGGGIVVGGRVLEGPNAIAGEWGHNPLPLPSGADLPLPACYCGRAGCVET